MSAMKDRLGIAITTYNRRDFVIGLCAAIRLFTESAYDLVVCDDGSSDGTVDALKNCGEIVIGGRNGGIARNKNRGLWYLLTQTRADSIILFDDDIVPDAKGWDLEWVKGTAKFGHVNFSFPLYRKHIVSGSGKADDPGLSPQICGCALGFSRPVIASIGFMDLRFGRYGHEHSDLSFRALRAGFGGVRAENRADLFYVIDGGLRPLEAKSSGTREEAQRNSELLAQISRDQIYRHAWNSDAERADFLSETVPL